MEVGNFETSCRALTLPAPVPRFLNQAFEITLRYCTQELFIYN